MAHDLLDDGRVGLAGLQDDQALLIALPAGPAAHLREHGKSLLVGTEVGNVEHGVGIEDAHDADMVEVEALGHHLRADEHVGLALGKLLMMRS